MSKLSRLNRRNFLKSSGIVTIAGTSVSNALASTSSQESRSTSATPFFQNGKFDFDTPYNRFGTDCYKWDDQVTKFGRDKFKIGMGVATMDFQAAPCIAEALNDRCEHENWGYMVIPDSYYESIVDWNRDHHGYELDPDSITISAGIYPGMIAALRTFVEPGNKVLLLTPAYSGFYYHTTHTNTVVNESEMHFNNGSYEIDWEDLEARMTPDTQAMIICNPHNPTGNVWTEEDLLRMGRLCLENQIVVLSDEVHCDLIRSGEKYVPFASLPDKAVVDNSISFKAISKTFSLAAMKNAYFFSTNPVYLERLRANHRPDINALGIVANEAAYRRGGEYLAQLLPYLDQNHQFVEAYIKRNMPLVSVTMAQGTYLSWLDVSHVIEMVGAKKMADESQKTKTPKTAEQIMELWFVEHAGVQLNPGSKYGLGGDGHMRMNLGTSRQTISLALESMREAINNIG